MKRRELIVSGLAVAASGTLRMPWAQAETPAEPKTPLVLGGHIGPISQISYSPDGHWMLASATKLNERGSPGGGETRLWDARTGKLERVLLPDIEGQRMQWSPDSRTLALPGMRWEDGRGTGSVQLWDTSAPDTEKWAARHTLAGANAAAIWALSPDGKYLLGGSENPNDGADIWNATDGAVSTRLGELSGFLASAAFARDGKSLFTASWRGSVDKFEGTDLQLWDTSGAPDDWELKRVQKVPERIFDGALSPDGKTLVWMRVSSDFKSAVLLVTDAASGEVQQEVKREGWLSSPQWSPDGKSLAAAHVSDATNPQKQHARALLFDTQNWSITTTLGDGKQMIRALAFSPDGKSLALGSGENAVEIYTL